MAHGIPGFHSLYVPLLFLLIGAIVFMLFRISRRDTKKLDKRDSLEILKRRLAAGEISIEEFLTLRNYL